MRPICVVALVIHGALLGAVFGCEVDKGERTSTTAEMTTTDAASTGDASTGAAESSGAVSTSGSSTGEPLPGACDDRTECMLYSDCCTCDALHTGETPPACDADCDRTLCEDWGITEILCSHTCLVRLVECDATLVECADAPPECADGFVPSVEARCWTRHCVPLELCTLPA